MNADDNTHYTRNLPSDTEIKDWSGKLLSALKTSRQRLLFICRGDAAWCHAIPSLIPGLNADVMLSDNESLVGAVRLSRAESLLGLEAPGVVFDSFSGFDADVFCMAAGLVRAGGMLTLLLPWPYDPVQDPYACWQGRVTAHAWFIEYLQTAFKGRLGVIEWRQGAPLPSTGMLPAAQLTLIDQGISADQRAVITQMRDWFQSRSPNFVLTAERGRGKSTTLALFALEQDAHQYTVVTAASRRQASVLLKAASDRGLSLTFMPPDEIIRSERRIELLLVDEAAMLPHNLLWQCLHQAERAVLATTTGGYEGTGQGFLLRFLDRLQQTGYTHATLQHPIRWGDGDLLECALNDVFFLQNDAKGIAAIDPGAIEIRAVAASTLAADRELLAAVYTLLLRAHYRTRPSQLRQLMEDENLRLLVAFCADLVVGVVLLNQEGGFDKALSEEVFLGRRRPQGHLFAQMITAQAGIREFACASGYRIQRIAVDESCRRQGIGRRLVEAAEAMLREQGLDYLASSFALDPDTAAFWRALDFHLLHIGSGRGTSTGRQSVAVIRSSSARVDQWVAQLQCRIADNLQVWLLTYCNHLQPQDVLALLPWVHVETRLTPLELDEVEAFCSGFRGLDLAQSALQKLLLHTLPCCSLAQPQAVLLVQRILLNRAWQSFDGDGAKGKKAMLREIRGALALCYQTYLEQNHE